MITPSSIAADSPAAPPHQTRPGAGTVGVGQALCEVGLETVHSGEASATEVGGVFVGWHPECGMKDIAREPTFGSRAD